MDGLFVVYKLSCEMLTKYECVSDFNVIFDHLLTELFGVLLNSDAEKIQWLDAVCCFVLSVLHDNLEQRTLGLWSCQIHQSLLKMGQKIKKREEEQPALAKRSSQVI